MNDRVPDDRVPDDRMSVHLSPDELTVARLRRALAASAGQVEPGPDSWRRLQAAITAESGGPPRAADPARSPFRRWLPVIAAAAAVIAVGGTATAVRWHRATPIAEVPAALTTYQPTPPPVQPLPVYYVAHVGERWSLVREFRPTMLTDPQERLQAAVDLAIAGRALDPDQTSVWRHLGLTGHAVARYSPQQIRVTLPSSLVTAPAPAGSSTSVVSASAALPDAGLGALAIEQLVWTATAANQQTLPVVLVAAGGERRLLRAALGDGAFTRSTLPAPLAPVWVNSLNEGDSLRTGTATIRCEAVATDDGAPSWTLLHQEADALRTVATGTAPPTDEFGQPTRLGQRGACVVHLPLAQTGRYRLEIRDDGWVQTREFVVR